jgi:hypothetical protein
VQLGQRAVGGEVGQRLPFAAPEPVEAVFTDEAGEDRFQRLRLQLEDGVPVDLAVRVQRAPRVAQAFPHAGIQPFPAGHLFDAQEKRVGEAAARRIVGGGLDGRHRRRRHQGVHHHHPATEAPGEAPDARQIGQIAHPPAGPRARRVDLGGEAPGAQIVGQEAVPGADDQGDVTVVAALAISLGMKPVVAVWQIAGQLALDETMAPVLQHQIGAALPPSVAAGDDDAHGVGPVVVGRPGVGIGPHGGLQRGARLVGRRVRGAGRVVEAGHDPERVGLGVLASVFV